MSMAPLLLGLAEAEAAAGAVVGAEVAAAEFATADVAAGEEICVAVADEAGADTPLGTAAPVSRPSPWVTPH